MFSVRYFVAFLLAGALSSQPPPTTTSSTPPGEWQLTFAPISHLLDNNDNFSRDDRFLAVDTRDTVGSGIGNGTSILKISVTTGLENVIYQPYFPITGASGSAPGLGAVSYNPAADEVVFIHGPMPADTPRLGFYSTTNRRAAVVPADGSGDLKGFLDYRDVTSPVTPPGAHRGGTHRHEYALLSPRIGFTYDDHLLTQYGRNIGMLVPHPRAPGGVSHWAVLLLSLVPTNTAAPGQLERAADDSWIGARALMRGFIGRVREPDGSYRNSLFVVDIPADVDVTTAFAGTTTEYPRPPQGLRVRRLTRAEAAGIVRGSLDGTRIAYYATAPDNTRQVFIIPSLGSDTDPDPAMRPVQATNMPAGVSGGVRWHPSGNSIAFISENGVAVTCVQPGPLFGRTVWLTTHGAGVPTTEALVWSHNGKLLAFNRRVPTWNAAGAWVKDFNNNDFRQVFLVFFPDDNDNGIADSIE
jgi:hypothetical protein